MPLANERGLVPDGSFTWCENFTAWWSIWRDDIYKRDLGWARSVHPNIMTVESWMRANNYTGSMDRNALKNSEDGKTKLQLNLERIAAL